MTRHDAPRGGLPREVWIATLTQEGIQGGSCDEVIACALRKMEAFLPQRPDIFCLPETFHYWNIPGKRPPAPELAAAWEAPIIEAMSGFARGNGCHVIAPIHTLENSACYNAAVLIDREGKRVGEYRKIRTTVEEMDDGVSPGPTDPPVFQTDLGVIGIQICFDIEWADGWRRLHEKGAEIVFWPSAFGGGKRVNTMAWTNKYCMVSSTALGTSRICDVTGETVLETGRWNSSGICAALNLEKALVHTWPYVERFAEIQVKYGRKVRIYNLHEEELTVIESRSADVKVADILREYQIKGWDEHLLDAEKRQERMRHSQGGD